MKTLFRVTFGVFAAIVFIGVGTGSLVPSISAGNTNGIVFGSVVLVLGFALMGTVLWKSPSWAELQRLRAMEIRPVPRWYLWLCGGMSVMFVGQLGMDIAEDESVWALASHALGAGVWAFLLLHQLRTRRKQLAELRAEGEQ